MILCSTVFLLAILLVVGGRFDALGVVHVHMRGLATEECDSTQQHCALRWSDSPTVGNMTLEFVRASLDAPRRKGASSSYEEAHRLDMQCYVGRHRYASVNAYHHSQSLSALAMELYRSHHDGVHPALRPTQSHHRLKRLVQQRVEQQQSDVDEEDDVMRDLEKEVSGRYAGPSSLFRDVVVSSASPAAPFLSPVDADRRIERGVDHGAGGLGLPDAPPRTLVTFHGVPGTPSAPESALHDTFTISGDLVVARYIRTNNWKYCRNVQHGLYFNMSHKSSEPFFENRCLVAQWLTDVCWVVDQSSTDASQWSVVGGCASNTGAAFQYTSLRDNRNDAHGHAKNADHGSQWIPLSVRVCVRSDVDKERPMSAEGQPTGASFTSSAGTVVPSFEFIRRLVLEVFEQQRPRQGGLVAAERLITFDWRDATYSGLRIPDPPSMSAVWWSLAAFLTIMIVFVLAVKFC